MRKFIEAGFSFAFLKAVVFFSPLLLVNYLSIGEYASLESGISMASIFVILANMSVSAAIPYFILKAHCSSSVALAILHSTIISILSFIIGLCLWFSFFSDEWLIFCFALSSFCLQRTLSSISKANGKPVQSSFFETGFYFGLLVALIVGVVFDSVNLTIVHLCSILVFFVQLFYALKNIRDLKLSKLEITSEKVVGLYGYSLNAMFVGLFIITIITSLRAFGLRLFSEEEYASYTLIFRFLSISIVFFQFLMTFYYPKIYKAGPEVINRYLVFFVVSIFIIAISLEMFWEFGANLLFNERNVEILSRNSSVVYPVMLLMPVWAATAFLENYIAREKLFKSFLKLALFSGPFLVFLLLVFLKLFSSDIEIIAYLHVFLLVVIIYIQYLVLKRAEINISKGVLLTFCFILVSVVNGNYSP